MSKVETINNATAAGSLVGVLLSFPAWWASGAPWWAIPVFVLTLGWLGGKVYGRRIAGRIERELKEKWPELKL